MHFTLAKAIWREMGHYVNQLEIDSDESDTNDGYDQGNDECFACLDNDITHSTQVKSKPNEHLSKIAPGKRKKSVSTLMMLAGREANYSGRGRFTSADRCHVSSRYLPVKGPWLVDQINSRAYVSQFSTDGSLFVTGFQVNTKIHGYGITFSEYQLAVILGALVIGVFNL